MTGHFTSGQDDAERARIERARIDTVYAARRYDVDPEYADTNPVYLHRSQSIERAYVAALRTAKLQPQLAQLRILDYGCGNGRWFGRWLAWGASSANLVGVDVRASAIASARESLPRCEFEILNGTCTKFAPASFDIVCQNLVLSSILDDDIRQSVASDMLRLLRPGGLILVCDFRFDNPRNRDVRAVRAADLRQLFRPCIEVARFRVVLAPPVARSIVPRSWLAAVALEGVFPFLRTHVLLALRKPPIP